MQILYSGPEHLDSGSLGLWKTFLYKKFFDPMQNTPSQAQKTIFTKFELCMWYGFRHVLMVQWGQTSELKPYL